MGVSKIYQPQVYAQPMMSLQGSAIADQSKQITYFLTSAQIATLHSVPITVLTGLSGWYVLVNWILFEFVSTSTLFTGGGDLTFVYHTAPTLPIHAGTIPSTIITAAAGRAAKMIYCLSGSTMLDVPLGDGVDLLAATADFGGSGTGTAKVVLGFRLVKAI